MADVIQPRKKQDPIKGAMPAIGAAVGSIYGGPVGGAAGGAVGSALAGDKGGTFESLSAAGRRMAMSKLKQGQQEAEQVGDAESSAIIQQALAQADGKNQSKISDGAIQRRIQSRQGGY